MCARRGFDDRGEFTARASGFPAEKRVRCSVLRDRRGRLRPMDGRAAGRERRPRLRALARTRPAPPRAGPARVSGACQSRTPRPGRDSAKGHRGVGLPGPLAEACPTRRLGPPSRCARASPTAADPRRDPGLPPAQSPLARSWPPGPRPAVEVQEAVGWRFGASSAAVPAARLAVRPPSPVAGGMQGAHGTRRGSWCRTASQ